MNSAKINWKHGMGFWVLNLEGWFDGFLNGRYFIHSNFGGTSKRNWHDFYTELILTYEFV